MNQRGTALLSTLCLTMILLPLGAFVVLQCRTDLAIQHNLRAEIEAFYVAEAGAEHAIAEIRPGPSFDDILAGPDHVAGTGDDGVFPFTEGAPSDFPFSPFRYDVRVSRSSDGVLHIVSLGIGLNGATKGVEELVIRSPLPFTPAALYAGGDVANLDVGNAGFLLSGLDHRRTDPPDAANGMESPVPALASPRADAELALRGRLTDDAAQQLVGAGGPPSIATTAVLDLQAYAAHFESRPERVSLFAATVGETPIIGTPAVPQISIVVGDVDVSGSLAGSGILVVQGTLHVAGTLAFSGLVLVKGDVVFDPASRVTVAGALWHGAGAGASLALRGSGGIVYSSAALADVDGMFPGLLPHLAVVAGWQEQL